MRKICPVVEQDGMKTFLLDVQLEKISIEKSPRCKKSE